MTGEYTVVQLQRQQELTQQLQEKLAQASKRRVKRGQSARIDARQGNERAGVMLVSHRSP